MVLDEDMGPKSQPLPSELITECSSNRQVLNTLAQIAITQRGAEGVVEAASFEGERFVITRRPPTKPEPVRRTLVDRFIPLI